MATPTSATAPSRTFTNGSDEDAVPGEDTSEVAKLFAERLSAWKHAVEYLGDYITATEKVQHAHGKEYEKVLKTVKEPLKHGHHFDQELGGIAGMFENIRANTQGISNRHFDTAKELKGIVLPVFDRLHTEIKHKSKELIKGAGKGSKAVDKARNVTQKHIELLGQHTASFESTGGKMTAADDPYVLQRGVLYRLHKQIQEENNNRQDLISVQNSFAQFEAHILQTIQHGLSEFIRIVNAQAESTKVMYGEMVGTAQKIPLDFEWNGFIRRNSTILIDPSAPPRSVSNVSFPNQNHPSTQPLISGSLERKGKIMRSYDTNYYAITPSKFLHEFKADDNFAKDPAPELSLYLPDCVVGACVGQKFNVKGKDVSKGKIGNTFSMNHELHFKAHTPDAAQKWWEIISKAVGKVTNSVPTSPISPTAEKQPAPLQTEGLEKQDSLTSPTSAKTAGPTPISAAPASAVPAETGKQ